jgi:hypothetical protein
MESLEQRNRPNQQVNQVSSALSSAEMLGGVSSFTVDKDPDQ